MLDQIHASSIFYFLIPQSHPLQPETMNASMNPPLLDNLRNAIRLKELKE